MRKTIGTGFDPTRRLWTPKKSDIIQISSHHYDELTLLCNVRGSRIVLSGRHNTTEHQVRVEEIKPSVLT